MTRSRASPPTSASTRARPSLQGQDATPPTTGSTSTAWATTAALGARKVATVQPSATLPQNQPNCLTDDADRAWSTAATGPCRPPGRCRRRRLGHLLRPARSARTPAAAASHIVFVVRDDAGSSDLLFQTSDTTWQAYNSYGGNSLYAGAPAGRAYKVSYNRPFTTRRIWRRATESCALQRRVPDGPLAGGQRLRRQLHHRRGHRPARGGARCEHKVFLSVGHDEYWSAQQRANVEAARDAGVHLAFFSGNEVFWKTRWENSIDGSGTPYRTLVCYKETHANAKIDPNPAWTGTWRDPRFSPPADGGRPENALTGTLFMVNGTARLRTPCRCRRRTARCASGGTRASPSLAPGQTATLPAGTAVGYEWDEDLDNGFRPAGPDSTCPRPPSTSPVIPAGLRARTTARARRPTADALPPRQRRAGLRGRHGPVVVGPRRHARQ